MLKARKGTWCMTVVSVVTVLSTLALVRLGGLNMVVDGIAASTPNGMIGMPNENPNLPLFIVSGFMSGATHEISHRHNSVLDEDLILTSVIGHERNEDGLESITII